MSGFKIDLVASGIAISQDELHNAKRVVRTNPDGSRLYVEGGFGSLWRAGTDGEYAVKCFFGNDFESAHKEFELLSKLNGCRYTPTVYCLGSFTDDNGVTFPAIVESFIRGTSLQQVIAGGLLSGSVKRGIDAKRASVIALEIAKALSSLADYGISHRDLSSGNIMLTESCLKSELKDGAEVVLIDFGQSTRSTRATVTARHDSRLACVPFGAPEVFGGDYRDMRNSSQCDTWSLGAIVVAMMAGEYWPDSIRDLRNAHVLSEEALDRIAEAKRSPLNLVALANLRSPTEEERGLSDIVRSCTEYNPHLRPTLKGVIATLESYTMLSPAIATPQIYKPSVKSANQTVENGSQENNTPVAVQSYAYVQIEPSDEKDQNSSLASGAQADMTPVLVASSMVDTIEDVLTISDASIDSTKHDSESCGHMAKTEPTARPQRASDDQEGSGKNGMTTVRARTANPSLDSTSVRPIIPKHTNSSASTELATSKGSHKTQGKAVDQPPFDSDAIRKVDSLHLLLADCAKDIDSEIAFGLSCQAWANTNYQAMRDSPNSSVLLFDDCLILVSNEVLVWDLKPIAELSRYAPRNIKTIVLIASSFRDSILESPEEWWKPRDIDIVLIEERRADVRKDLAMAVGASIIKEISSISAASRFSEFGSATVCGITDGAALFLGCGGREDSLRSRRAHLAKQLGKAQFGNDRIRLAERLHCLTLEASTKNDHTDAGSRIEQTIEPIIDDSEETMLVDCKATSSTNDVVRKPTERQGRTASRDATRTGNAKKSNEGRQRAASKKARADEWLRKARKLESSADGARNIDLIRTYYEYAANAGSAEAQYTMGLHCSNGDWTKQDKKKAFDYFQRASQRGYILATFKVARCYLEGDGVKTNQQKGFGLCKKAAANGVPEANTLLAQCYRFGWGTTSDMGMAVKHLLKAAESGDVRAQYEAGAWLRYSEYASEINGETALNYLSLSSKSGYAPAQYELAHLYDTGRLVAKKDEVQALTLLRLSAEQGYSFAQFEMGNYYLQGKGGLKIDFTQAVHYYQLAAENGNSDAQLELGLMHLYGRGVKRNTPLGIGYIQRSAQQENTKALLQLGSMYEKGKGVDVNLDEAVRLYKLASDKGSSEAQRKLKSRKLRRLVDKR